MGNPNNVEYAVLKRPHGIISRTPVISGRPLDEVSVDSEGIVDISALQAEITRGKKIGRYIGKSPFKRRSHR